jgi:RNA polymerase-binding transcription factor
MIIPVCLSTDGRAVDPEQAAVYRRRPLGPISGRNLDGVDDSTVLGALAELRADTRRRIDALRRQVDVITEASALTTHDDEHDPEGATVGFERAQAQSLLAAARRDLAAVDHAERRVRAGTYSTCERCGGPITDQRIVALPAASTCINCASRRRC